MLKLKSEILKDMVAKAVKGASNNKLIPLTSMLTIEAKDNQLRLITTDATLYLVITEKNIPVEDFYVTVQAEQFAKLIAKLTCAEISLEVTDNFLIVKGGNGTYKVDICLDEMGNVVKFPTPFTEVNVAKKITIPTSTLKLIINSCVPAVAVTFEEPCYTGVYFGDSILATDTQKICSVDKKLFDDENLLISADSIKLMDIVNSDNVDISLCEDGTVIVSDDVVTIYTPQLAGIDDYQVASIMPLLEQEFSASCKISRSEFITLLDRIMLFVGVYDNGGIELTFTENGLQVSSKQSNGVELLKYTEAPKLEEEFKCMIDVRMLLEQLKAQNSDIVELFIGNETAIKLTDGQVTQLIALLVEA